ncbi:MAG: hypothetical protein C4533_06405 [Candidatus Omnitrophota bacterium]|jgi:UDP-N-acetylglucosamine 2-epimerase|nr:MAG: hypothetical protein C4533_06405 [Candidatus Omnitrophota bacterium]
MGIVNKKEITAKKLIISYIPMSGSMFEFRFKAILKKKYQDCSFVCLDLRSRRIMDEIGLKYSKTDNYLDENKAELFLKSFTTFFDFSESSLNISALLTSGRLTLNSYLNIIKYDYLTKAGPAFFMEFIIREIIYKESPDEVIIIFERGIFRKVALNVLKEAGIKHGAVNTAIDGFILRPIVALLKIKSVLKSFYLYCYDVLRLIKRRSFISAKVFQNKILFSDPRILPDRRVVVAGYNFGTEMTLSMGILDRLRQNGWHVDFISSCFKNFTIRMMTTNKINVFILNSMVRIKDGKIINQSLKTILNEIRLNANSGKGLFYKHSNLDFLAIDNKLRRYFFSSRAIKDILIYIFGLQKYIHLYKPELLIINSDASSFGYLAVKIAKESNVASVSCPGLFQQFFNKFMPSFDRGLCDKLLVSGERIKEHLVKNGSAQNRVIAIGVPNWEAELKKRRKLNYKDFCNSLKVSSEKDIILFTSQGLEEDAEIIRMLINLMRANPDKQLIFKLHPCENGGAKALRIRLSGLKNIKVVDRYNLWELIDACRILITCTSVTVLQAMILDKPSIVIKQGFRPYLSDFIKEGGVVMAEGPKSLDSTVNRLVKDVQFRQMVISKGRDFIEKYCKAPVDTLDYLTEALIRTAG